MPGHELVPILSLMQRRSFLQLFAPLLATSACYGCSSWPLPPLRIAKHLFPTYELFGLAYDEGWLDPQLVELVKTSSASHCLNTLADNHAAGAMLTLDEVLKARSEGIELTIVLILDRSVGADALLAAPGINGLTQLKGKRLGVEYNGVGRLFMAQALNRAELKPSDIQLINLPYDQHLTVASHGNIDAIITFEPILSLVRKTGWQVLIDSREIAYIFDVLAIRTDQLQRHRAAIINLTQSYLLAAQRWFDNPVDSSYRLSRHLQVPAAEVAEQFKRLAIPNLDFNRHLLAVKNRHLLQISQEISDILGYQGAMQNAETTLFSTDFLPQQLR